MLTLTLVGLQVTGKIGVGTIITLLALIVAAFWANRRWQQGDPSEWRENYLGEVTKSQELEAKLAMSKETIVALQRAKDITGLEDRLTRRMDTFEEHAKQQTEVLRGLMQAVTSLVERVTTLIEKGTPA